MKTVVLAGGFGTRLRLVVKDLPKPLAPVNGRFFLDYVLEQLKKNGLKDFIFCLHYQPEKFIKHYGDGSHYGVNITYSIEKEPLGTGGALGLQRNFLSENFCVINADTYLELDIKACLNYHKDKQALMTMALAETDDRKRFGEVELGRKGTVEAFYEKVSSNKPKGYVNAGLYIMKPDIFEYIPQNTQISLERAIFPFIIKSKQALYGYPLVTNFFDIGIPEDYEHFVQWVKQQEAIG